MKRRISLFTALLLFMLSAVVYADEIRMVAVAPSLTFDGTTAHCSVDIYADLSTDKIDATITQWNGTNCLETWNKSAYGELHFYNTCKVELNKQSSVNVIYYINGGEQTSAWIHNVL